LGLEPDFLYPLENVTIAQGRDATFTCVVNNLGGYRVSGDSATARVAWIKADTKAILAIHEHVITNNARLSVTHNDYNTWTLNIRGTAFLEVVIPPDIIYEETSGDMMVPEGGAAKLVCKARGYPPPKIIWRREDGGDIISRGGPQGKTKVTSLEGEVVNLTKVTRSEMGAYLCIAANGVPPSVSKRIMLHYQMSEINSSAYSVQMRLIIRNIQRSDLGGYKCISKNSIGDAEGNIRLYEMELPYRKSRVDDESETNYVETNDVRSSLQGPLREGGHRSEDNDFTSHPSSAGLPNIIPLIILSCILIAMC
ncbi:unnamed protein product, partial [Leptidea sinapis]